MIKQVLIGCLVFFPLLSFGQYSSYPWFYFEIGDTLAVLAKSGLNLRESSTTDSKKIGVVGFGEKVVAKGLFEGRFELDNRRGSWVKVNFKGVEGYLFSGFLTKLKMPKFREDDIDCYQIRQFEEFIQANLDTLLCQNKYAQKGHDLDGKDSGNGEFKVFRDGTFIQNAYGYESHHLIIETGLLNMNDVLNWLDFYVLKLNDCKYTVEADKPKVLVQMDEEGFIKKIECVSLKFIAEKSPSKVVIVIDKSY